MSRDEPDDAELVRRCQRGDAAAFGALVSRYSRFAGAVALGVITDYDAARDVVQDAFLKVFEGVGRMDDPGAFRGWLRNVVRTTALDHRRRRGVAGRSGEPLPGQDEASAPLPAPGPSPDELLARAELRAEVRAEIAELPDGQRELVMLKYVDGLSYEEIAASTGLTVATIESRLFRARSRLRSRLGARFAPSGPADAPDGARRAREAARD